MSKRNVGLYIVKMPRQTLKGNVLEKFMGYSSLADFQMDLTGY